MAKDKGKKKDKKKKQEQAPAAEQPQVKASEAPGEPLPNMSRKDFEKALEPLQTRAGQDAGVGQSYRDEDLRGVRRTRYSRKRRRDQAHHRAGQPTCLPCGGIIRTDRAGEITDVLPALHASSYQPPEKWCSSTAAGTTGRESSG